MPAAALTYIEAVAEADGHTSVAQGVMRPGVARSSVANGVRVYRVGRRVYDERLSVQEEAELRRALLRVIRRLLPQGPRTTIRRLTVSSGRTATVRIRMGARPRVQILHLGGHQRPRAQAVPPEDSAGFVNWLDAWRRNASPDEVVVEVEADAGELEAIARELEPPADEAIDTGLPDETDASAARREALLRSWLTAADVADRMGSRATNRGAIASRLRRDGELLGVWVVSENGYRHPDWQFDANSRRPYPAMKDVLALLQGPGGPMHQRATSGWEEVEWFLQPRASLGGSAPFELLASAPGKVIERAQLDAAEDPDASW
jgi:hypothetical protein